MTSLINPENTDPFTLGFRFFSLGGTGRMKVNGQEHKVSLINRLGYIGIGVVLFIPIINLIALYILLKCYAKSQKNQIVAKSLDRLPEPRSVLESPSNIDVAAKKLEVVRIEILGDSAEAKLAEDARQAQVAAAEKQAEDAKLAHETTEKAKQLDVSATKIQTAFRGHRVRNLIKVKLDRANRKLEKHLEKKKRIQARTERAEIAMKAKVNSERESKLESEMRITTSNSKKTGRNERGYVQKLGAVAIDTVFQLAKIKPGPANFAIACFKEAFTDLRKGDLKKAGCAFLFGTGWGINSTVKIWAPVGTLV